jgi:hypothetical protein
MYDIAREQSPREDVLRNMLERSLASGYNAVGFYLEHRFRYRSAPWAATAGALEPSLARQLAAEFRPRGLRIIPFLNTLGHMEGFIRCEGGQWLAEGPSDWPGGVQICPSRPECVEFARHLVADAIDAFADEWDHVGVDETRQLGQCPQCAERVARIGAGGLYGEYFRELCRWVLERGRRPCLWGDMLIQHPHALDCIPRETVIFDWHYFDRPRASTHMFRERGFDVVCCPSIQTYNAAWCFLHQTQQNIDEHAEVAAALGALGVMVTTWEHAFFSQYDATMPLVHAAGRRLARGEDWNQALRAVTDDDFMRAAEILGNRIPAASSFLAPGTWRHLRDRLVVRQDPFALWRDWRGQACGPIGDELLRLLDEAARFVEPGSPLEFPLRLHVAAVSSVRLIEAARRRYATGELAPCADLLDTLPALFEPLRAGLLLAAEHGGSTVDLCRLDRIQSKVREVVERIRGVRIAHVYRPAFETLIHDAYIAGDQAAWRTGGPGAAT